MNHELFGIRVDDLSDGQLASTLDSFLRGDKTQTVATPNPEMILDALNDNYFGSALGSADLCLPDGVALRFAVCAMTDKKLKNRHTGVDTLELLLEICAKLNKRILFLGAKPKVLQTAKKNVQNKINVEIDVLDPGTVKVDGERIAIDSLALSEIKKIKPDVIALALSHKKQVIFMSKFKREFPSVKVMIGIGGALDMIAGKRIRAPRLMRKAGLEWLWRVLIEPSRIDRIIHASIIFPYRVILEAIRKKRFLKALKSTIPEIFKQLLGR